MTETLFRNNNQFEWDKAKSRANFQKHGYKFEDVIKIFDGPTLESLDDRFDYSEQRYLSIGLVDGIAMVAVAHTDRNGVIRIISARRATKTERKAYDKRIR